MELQTRLLEKLLNAVKGAFSGTSLPFMRKGQERLGALGVRSLGDSVFFTSEKFENFEAAFACPIDAKSDIAVLYLHGGAYVSGGISYAKSFGGTLAALLFAPVLCVNYRKAPEHPYPAALEDAFAAYLRLREAYPNKRIAVIGESAGGGLSLALGLKIKEQKGIMPDLFAVISPWSDLSFSGVSYMTNTKTDPTLNEESLKHFASLYIANDDPKNPFISPIYGDFSGFPPVLIIAGTEELLHSDSLLTASALIKGGVKHELYLEKGMWHVYPLYPTPEAERAKEKIKEFVFNEG
ncbi:MAG: alpha/beta hydrolase [Clostridia bacterium]|nr:alpha/beta hydrolase [Clostridia bacterium]